MSSTRTAITQAFFWMFFGSLVFLTGVQSMHGQAHPPYRLAKAIHVGGEGGWDYITFDPSARRLYVSHGNQVVVVNAETDSVVATIPNTPGVHGIALAADLGKGFISNGRSSSVTVFDLASLKERKGIAVGENPDAILYDPFSRKVFVFNGRSGTASVINADSENVVATIPLGGKPEFAVTDNAGRIFVNIEDKSEVLALEARSATILSRWPLSPGEGPSGLAIDITHHRLFTVCSNKLMIVLDAEDGRVLASLPTGRGTDGCAFDPELGYAFASNGEGSVTVVHEESPTAFTVVGNVPTHQGARTITVDTQRHILYLPTAEFGPIPEPTAERPRPRPPIKPDTFQILKLERQ